jgi:ferritin-like metal-binding protein YciE
MEKLMNLKDLLADNAERLYNAEQYEQKNLPGLRKQSRSPELHKIMDRQLQNSQNRSHHLEELMKQLNVKPNKNRHNHTAEKIFEAANELTQKSGNDQTRDAAIISSLQQLSHYDQSECGVACSYAQSLGFNEIADQLHRTLDEEKEIDRQLSNLAMDRINREAQEGLPA